MNEEDSSTEILATTIFAFCLVIYIKFQPAIVKLKLINWKNLAIDTGKWLLISIIIVIVIYFLYQTCKRIKVRKQKERDKKVLFEEYESEVKNILNHNFKQYISSEAINKLHEFKEYTKRLPDEIISKYNINDYYKRINNLILKKRKQELKIEQQRIFLKEQAKIEELQREQLEQEQFEVHVSELINFKKSKKSIKALPLNKVYSERVISHAEFLMREHIEEKEKLRCIHEEAIQYYKENDLDSKPYLTSEEEPTYAQVREDIKSNKIQLKKEVKPIYYGKKLESNFYRAKDLDNKEDAKSQGFEFVHGIELDGKVSGGFYIKKENNHESNKHFYLKHLFAELHENMVIEYQIQGKRVDVFLPLEDFKLGIEIETGVNKIEQIIEKVDWLNKHFNQWMFVCPRKDLSKYQKFVDNKKSLCFTPKKAKESILELISTVEHR